MLNKVQVWKAFTQSTPELRTRLAVGMSRAASDQAARDALCTLTHVETRDRLQTQANPWTGARTTAEVDQQEGFCIPFHQAWNSRREAQTWAHEQLAAQAVVAVDGSQLPPERGMSLPIGAIQIGYYYNDPLARAFAEAQEFSLVLPAGLILDAKPQDQDLDFSQRVAQQRFVRECTKLMEVARSLAHKPIGFFDNTFILSYVQRLDPDNAQVHLDTVQAMLAESQACTIPLVGYVDTSYSRDLCHMLHVLYPELDTAVTDATLLHGLLPNWGDRTPFMQCARADAISQGKKANAPSQEPVSCYYTDIGFVYMRTDPATPPARIEIPMWVYTTGQLEQVLDVIRAQCIYGDFHYPSALALADRNAVLTRQDRAQFYDWLRHYMDAELDYRVHRAAKANSKRVTRPPV